MAKHMKKYLTWRDIRNYLNELGDADLDKVALVELDDMVWMIDYNGTAGSYPITNIEGPCICIDDGSDVVFGY